MSENYDKMNLSNEDSTKKVTALAPIAEEIISS